MGKYQEGVQTTFVVLATVITLYFQFTADRSIQSVAFFGILITLVIFYFGYSYVRDKFSRIEINAVKIKNIEERINKRKGQLDPQIIIIIFILIVLLLYLRSIGFLKF